MTDAIGRRMLSRRAALALPALIGGGLGGPGPARAQSDGAPKRGGTLTFAVAAEPPTYDLHATGTFAVMHRVAPHYSTLLRYEPGNYPNIVGDLAESWTASDDRLTYTFRLHPGVRFHDGTLLTSEDVKASYDRMRAPPEGVVSNRQPSFGQIASIETPDPLTVVFRMKAVDASIMDTFASPWNSIFSAARLKADPNFPARNIMGTGPFRFVEHVAGSHWVGERFDGYFRQGRPYLDGFRAITMSPAAMVNALSGGQILAEFRGFTPNERDRIVKALGEDARVQESSWMLHMILTFNCQRKPFDDPRVRRALSLAIDRWGGSRNLSKISQLGQVGGLVRPGSEWSATPEEMEKWPGYGRDLAANRAEARRLLREAGAENLTFTLLDRNHQPYVTAGIFMIDQWRQIGVRAEHQQVELSSWYAAQNSGNFEAFVDSFTQFSDDPTNVLVKYISYDRAEVAVARATDRELDRLFDEQAKTIDTAERKKLVRQFESRLLEQSYAVPILWWQRIVVMNSRVRGWSMAPTHMIYQDLGDVWLAA
ncbi:ABC transporter substrate-binding protein [Roseomonas sp. OT10]|uniref:ABC transporter substrate-binding protein n=1 Tax=Roseomonas cutis TaxID=2897332 RepID=UPI001E461D21|nr:ABC transporter substrate-binding protein [Roseomonas sp. OT10]UFN48428.1 ABC transporter substrate-binding protein [Roseomonas sp. OT10]